MTHDPVNAPGHYTCYPVQPIAITRHLGFCPGNAVKYVLRAPYKGGVEDCDKALQYLKWESEQRAFVALYSLANLGDGDALNTLILYLQDQQTPVTGHQEAFLRFLMSYVGFSHQPSLKEMIKEVRGLRRALLGGEV